MIRIEIPFWTIAFAALLVSGVASTVEAAVLVVDRASPQAKDSGPGTAAQPLRTLAEALRRIQPGDVVQIAPGVYRESIDLRHTSLAHGTSDARTVIEGRDSSSVTIKGSDSVTGWKALGDDRYVRHDWQVNSQQVFVDGRALRQIGGTILHGFPDDAHHPLAKIHVGAGGIWPGRTDGSADEMPYGSFYYDRKRHDLYVRVHAESLDEHKVEVSVRPFLVIGEGINNLTLRNMTFRHANTTDVAQSGAVSLRGNGLALEDLDIQHVDGAGMDITGDHNLIRSVTADYCGQLGIKARGTDVHVIDNDVSYNNTRGFNKWWEAGGAKFVGGGGLKDSVVSGNTAIGNEGDGIWFDWLNQNNRVEHNVVAYNSGFGIQYEASSGAVIRSNQVFSNKQRGIYLPNSRDSKIEQNLVVDNGLGGIVAVDARHGKYGKYDLQPRNNRFRNNILAWNRGAQITIADDADGARSDHNLFVTEPGQQPSFSEGFGSKTQPKRIGLEAWKKASGQDKNSVAIDLAMPPGLEKSLSARDVRPDWSVLLRERQRVGAPLQLGFESRKTSPSAGEGS